MVAYIALVFVLGPLIGTAVFAALIRFSLYLGREPFSECFRCHRSL